MSVLILVALLAAPTDGSVRLASPGMSYVQVEAKVGDFFNEYFAQQLVLQGIRVTTRNEISALLGFERQRELLGCAEQSTSCLAEMAGALGVDGLITGSMAKLGSGYAVNIKIISAKNGQSIAAYTTRVKGDDALLDWLAETAKAFASEHRLAAKPAVLEPPGPPELSGAADSVQARTESGEPRPSWVYPAIAGGALVLGGAAGLVMTSQRANELRGNGTLTQDQVRQLASEGAVLQTGGFVALGAGAAVLGVAGALAAFGGSKPLPVSVAIRPGAAGIVFTGALP